MDEISIMGKAVGLPVGKTTIWVPIQKYDTGDLDPTKALSV